MAKALAVRSRLLLVVVGLIALTVPVVVGARPASAAPGGALKVLTPSPGGNGRAVTFDPATGHLFYTNAFDPHIYVIDTSGNPVATLNPIDPSGQHVSYA